MTKPKNTAEEQRNQLRSHWYGKIILFTASMFYWLGISIREKLYKAGKLKSEKLDIPVICVGNLSTGGTGKTPAIITLSTLLLKENHLSSSSMVKSSATMDSPQHLKMKIQSMR